MLVSDTLNVCEIFKSIQGEGVRAGMPCTMVRLGGCNLRCNWCDTKYAQDQHRPMTMQEILDEVAGLGCRRVELTGGEPLIQTGAIELLTRLVQAGYETLLETNGSMDLGGIDARVFRIMDIKCPSSGQAERLLHSNIQHLASSDEVKFILADRTDYDYAKDMINRHAIARRCTVTLSPAWGLLAPDVLAEWMLQDGLDVRLGLQLHKIIWPGKDRGV